MLEKGSDHPNGVSRPKGDNKSIDLPHTVPNWEERLAAARAQRERALMARHLNSKKDSAPTEAPPAGLETDLPEESAPAAAEAAAAEVSTPDTAMGVIAAEIEERRGSDLFTAVTDRLGRSLVVSMACFASLGFGLAVGVGTLFGVGSMRAPPPVGPETETVAQTGEDTVPMYADPAPLVVAALPEPAPAPDAATEPAPVGDAAPEAAVEPMAQQSFAPEPEEALEDVESAPESTLAALPDQQPAQLADSAATPDAAPSLAAETAPVAVLEAVAKAAPPQSSPEAEPAAKTPLPAAATETAAQPEPPIEGALSLIAWLPLQPVTSTDAVAEPATTAISPPDPLPGTEWTLAEKLRAGGTDLSTLDLRVYAPDAVPTPRHETNMDKLAGTGLAVEAVQRVDFTVSAAHIRYYNTEDSGTAEALAEALNIEARDFTDKRTGPAGLIEVWFAGAPKGKLAEELSTRRNGRYLFDRLRDKLRSD